MTTITPKRDAARRFGGRLLERGPEGAAGRQGHGRPRLVAALALLAAMCAGLASTSLGQGGGPQPFEAPPFDDARRAAAVDSIATALLDAYVFADVAEDMVALMRKNFDRGEYDQIDDPFRFADRLTEDLRSVSHDRHLRVFPLDPRQLMVPPAMRDHEDLLEEERAAAARDNFGFQKLERLPGNVGYLRLDGFVPAELGGATAVAAMNFLANCDALIIDLRENGGGSPSMIQLLTSYLFAQPTHLNSFYIRRTDETQQFWTHAHVQGPRLTGVDVYVLTSSFTFSAAEEFTYNLKNLERATIVGETTGGGAHPVEGHVFAYVNLGVSLPFGRAINPITGTNWEGTGVAPDVAVPAAQALDTAHLMALERLIEQAEGPAAAEFAWAAEELRARLEPVSVEPVVLSRYVGKYGDREIASRDGEFWYRRGERPPMRLIPMTATLFRFQEVDNFRLEVELDPSGVPVALVGHYADGHTDRSERSAS